MAKSARVLGFGQLGESKKSAKVEKNVCKIIMVQIFEEKNSIRGCSWDVF